MIKENKFPFLFIIIASVLLSMVLSFNPDYCGDSREYIQATQSILHDGDLIFSEKDLDRFLTEKIPLRSPANLPVVMDQQGDARNAIHPFYYSLFCVPFYYLFSFRGFAFFNALMFFLCLLMIWDYLRDKKILGAPYLAIAFLFFSSAFSYVFWIHAEILEFFLITSFLYFWHKKKPMLAAFFIGLATAVKFPVALLFLPFLFDLLWIEKNLKKTFLSLGSFSLALSPLIIYNLFHFSALEVVEAVGMASPENIELYKILRVYLDPYFGLIWFYPMVLFSLLNIDRSWLKWVLIVLTLPILTLFCGTSNFISAQVGWRYLICVYPVFIFSLGSWKWNRKNVSLIILISFFGAGFLLDPLGYFEYCYPWKPPFASRKIASRLGIKSINEFALNEELDPFPLNSNVWVKGLVDKSWTDYSQPVEIYIIGLRGSGKAYIEIEGSSLATKPQKITITTLSNKDYHYHVYPGKQHVLDVSIKPEDISCFVKKPYGDINFTKLTMLAEVADNQSQKIDFLEWRRQRKGQPLNIFALKGLSCYGVQLKAVYQPQNIAAIQTLMESKTISFDIGTPEANELLVGGGWARKEGKIQLEEEKGITFVWAVGTGTQIRIPNDTLDPRYIYEITLRLLTLPLREKQSINITWLGKGYKEIELEAQEWVEKSFLLNSSTASKTPLIFNFEFRNFGSYEDDERLLAVAFDKITFTPVYELSTTE